MIGIGEAAYYGAAMLAPKFGVVTTLSRSVVGLEANLAKYGLSSICTGIRTSDLSVLGLESMDDTSLNAIRTEVALSLTQDHAEAIILGCAGMSHIIEQFAEEFQVPIIDGVKMGVTMLEALHKTGTKTSHYRTYKRTF